MADELLSIEMRLTVDRALREYNEFKTKLQRDPIDVKFDLGLTKVLADAQAHFNKHKISVALDWSEARSSFVKLTKDFDSIKTKIHVDDSELSKLRKDITEIDRALIDIGVKVDRSGFDAFEKQVKGLSDRSIKLSALTDTKGFDAFQKSMAALSDRTISISGGSGIGALQKDVKSLVADLKGLGDRVVNLSVNRSGANELGTLVAELAALQDKRIDLRVDVKGEEVTALNATIAELKSKAALMLKVDVVGDDIQSLLGTIEDIRAKALKLDVQVAGGEFKDLVGALDQMRSEVVKVQFSSDISGLAVAHDRIQDFQEAAHNGIKIPITTDDNKLSESVAQLRAIEKLAIQVEVDKGKLAAAVALIQSNLNPEDFVAKLTIDTSDLEGSAKRLREAQKEFTAYRREVEESFSTKTVQSAITDQLRNVKILQEANEDRIRRENALARFENTQTMKEFQAWAKELSITPTTGLKKADYEAMFKSLLEIEDAAELVAKAWKITGQKFDSVTDEMEAKSEHTKNVLWGNLNHGAADLVRFAWDRTSDSFKGDLKDMEKASERAGKQISEALSAAAKDSTFKLTVDSKQAKKDLGDFQNYARLLAKNDLAFNINKLKADTNYAELETQLKSLQRLKREAAKEDKGNIQIEIDGVNDQIAAYKRLEKAANDEYRARIDALDTQSKAYKVLIANQEQLERSTTKANTAQSTFDKEQTQARMDRINGYLEERKQRVQTSNANRAAYVDEFNRTWQLKGLNQQRAAERKKLAEDATKFDEHTRRDAWVNAHEDKTRMDKLNADIRAGRKLALDQQLADLQKSVDAEFETKRKASLEAQKRFIQDTMALKDTKVDPSGAGGLGMAGIGADLSKLDKLQEKLEAVQRTKRELIQGGIDLKINDNLDQFRTALNKLAKEEITITAKIKEEYEGGKPGGKLGGALKSIGGEFLQAFNIDLQSVVQGAIQGYQAIAGGIFSVAKASLAEFGAIQASAQKSATLLESSGRNTNSDGSLIAKNELIKRLQRNITKVAIAEGNLFGGKEIGEAVDEAAKAGGSLRFIESNFNNIAVAATAAGADLKKTATTSLAVAQKFAAANDTVADTYEKQKEAVFGLTYAMTNSRTTTDNYLKSIQYLNTKNSSISELREAAIDITALSRIGVIGSKVGTNMNSVFKNLANTLEGTNKKAANQQAILAEISAAVDGVDTKKFVDDQGNFKNSTEAMGELTKAYGLYAKTVGNVKASTMFKDMFDVQGVNALSNAVAVYTTGARDEIKKGMEAAGQDVNAFTKKFADSMSEGYKGGLVRLENIRDTYYNKIGEAIGPMLGGVTTLVNSVLDKSLKRGAVGLGPLLDKIQKKFEGFGKNESLVNGLARAFNTLTTAVGGKLLGLVERLLNYLSDEQAVMELAHGISFWITATIDAFTTATELMVGIGVAAANVGNILSGKSITLLSPSDAVNLDNAMASIERLGGTKDKLGKYIDGAMGESQTKLDMYKQGLVQLNTQLEAESGSTQQSLDRRTKILEKMDAYKATIAGLEGQLKLETKELERQQKIVDEIRAKENEPQPAKKPGGLFDPATWDAATIGINNFRTSMKWLDDWKTNDDIKYIWDKFLGPILSGLAGGAMGLLGLTINGVALAIKGVAAVVGVFDPETWKNVGYFIKQTGKDAEEAAPGITAWSDGILNAITGGTSWSEKSIEQATAVGKWVQDKASETTAWFAAEEEKRTLHNAEEGAKREAYWNEQGARIQQSISTVATWFNDRWRETGDWWNGLMTGMQTNFGIMVTGLGNVWNNLTTQLWTAWGNFTKGIGAAFAQAQATVLAQLNTIAQAIGNLASRIPGVFQAAWNAAAATVGTIGTAIQNVFGNAFNVVQNAVGGLVQNFQNAWSGAIDAIGGQIGGLIDRARQIPVVGGLIPGFASGGVIMGPASKTDNVMIMARGGEGVLVPEAVRALGGAAGLERLNRRAEAGALGFAAGGVISPIKGTGGKGSVSVVSANPPAVNSAIVTTAKTAEKAAVLARTVALDQATYWARSLALLNNLYAGMKSISDKISQLKVTFAQPIASYSSGSGLFGAPALSAAPASNPLTVFNNGVLASRGGAAGSKTEIRVARTGKTDSEGLEILRMDLVELGTGRIVDSVLGNSGVRSAQTYTSGNAVGARPGSLAPIPTGRFGIAPTTTSSDPGIQGWFVPITGAGDNKQGRGDFGIHMDANRAMSPGSAGCIVLYDPAAKSRVQAWLNNANAPKELTVSYGNATAIDGSAIAAAMNSSVSRGTGGKGAYKKLFKIGSDADLYQMAITAITEGLAGSPTSQLDSAVSIANRVNAGGFGKDAKSVVSAPGAYEAYTRFGLSGVTDRASAEAKLRSLGYKDSTLENFLKALDDNAMLLKSVEHLKGSTDYRAYVPGATLQARAGDPQRTKNDNYYIPGGDSYASINAAKARQLHVQAQAVISAAGASVAASTPTATQKNLTQAQINFQALTEKLNPADQALVASVDAGDTAQAAAELKKRLDELSAQRDALIKSAPKPADPKKATEAEVKANKALQEKVAALDKRKTELQSVINATYKIDTAETQISNRKAEAAYNDEMAALNEYARLIGGAKEDAKESAKLRDLMRARDESQAEVAIAQKNKARDLEILEVENASAIKREQSRKGGDVEALRKLQALQKTDKIAALDEAIREAQYAVGTQNNKLEDFYRVNGLDDRADALAEVIALQKRVREKSIDQQELDAALKRLGIANINGQFVVDKALTAQLSDISGKVEKAAERSQGQIEKLMRGQGLVLKDALFEALDLEYNYYMQKRDSDLNKASAEQLSFLYGKNLLRTGSFEGGSYIQGAQGNLRDRLGEISLTSEAAIRNKKLDAINALYQAGGIDEAMAKAMAANAGGSVEVIRAGVNPGLKQATGKRLTALSDVPYTPRSEIQAAIRESQSAVAAPLVAASAPSAGYMAKATAPMRIKLDIPPGTDERITSVVRQTEAALNSDEYTQRMLGEFMSILRSDPQLARQISF